jgi:excisionase family DNA binding protein
MTQTLDRVALGGVTLVPAQEQNDELLTFKGAMGYLKVSRSTLYRLMWCGDLKSHKVGSTWRFFRSDVRACVRNNRASS